LIPPAAGPGRCTGVRRPLGRRREPWMLRPPRRPVNARTHRRALHAWRRRSALHSAACGTYPAGSRSASRPLPAEAPAPGGPASRRQE